LPTLIPLSIISDLNWNAVSAMTAVALVVFAAGGTWTTIILQTQRMIKRQDMTNGSIIDLKASRKSHEDTILKLAEQQSVNTELLRRCPLITDPTTGKQHPAQQPPRHRGRGRQERRAGHHR
jgi:hypothetical protein